ncbi:MAG: FadR family transcriptional regulator [Desulfobacula sp.]|jgi:DNA-binding FadR family transcriptional regulator|uniref:FadR/GntR family transcriptional regulator n=1 Tax=Desulfobacula sp. TaxID=2593537 RepID=UPI001D499309|nr:FadR family transcriptional regulator [Desulfobacula sp.]MBT3806509.1 FadR family transcriptional regulator [Desulfobacula sp.]MBT4027200.1 FadR family transcriptional regulator [Desulfobacula sp.]MBT4200722.1 FadR family transcriptional regulator [Desulfobacula sp.]MBT4875367.1 FadR family transcriptional regulator [Desulfobacula sp.]
MFKKAKQNRVFQDVVEQIQDAIIKGKLKPGARLPAERELKDLFNTSRGTLREALRVLEQKGLIEIKLGVSGGAIVKRIDAEPIVESLALLIRSGEVSIEHLSEFRIKIEGSLVELAAMRATKEEIAELETMFNQAKDYYEKNDWENFLKTDEKMHTYIGIMTQNPVFQFVQKTIHDNIHQYYDEYLPMNKERTLENLTDFEKIIEAMKINDAKKASDIIMDHVKRFSDKMQEKTRSKSNFTMQA